jgi:hydrogenase maturation protein HypF
MPQCRRRLELTGVVQGVGFRPFVFNLAKEHQLNGWVCNHTAGVTIEVEGDANLIEAFEHDLSNRSPPLAVIDSFIARRIECIGACEFVILPSSKSGDLSSTPVPPDIATCQDCLNELNDVNNRRFGYPFLNCINCGPRFTIIRDLPYDRAETTICAFRMCLECEAEYHDPGNRRFHAQANACPKCGSVAFLDIENGSAAIQEAKSVIESGGILAVKGIGGFHLACDATNNLAVENLRERKNRFEQPFAVMARDMVVIRQIAEVNAHEENLLSSRQRPIVLLKKQPNSSVANQVAPRNGYIGVMLPYSPLHHLLLDTKPLVMTSANPSGEPIVRGNLESRQRLSGLADAFLMHNRDIEVVCDDSVVRTFENAEMPLRRSRGYAPLPIRLTDSNLSVLAVGADLKSTFCIVKDHFAYLSQHIGDMGSLETIEAFERALKHMLGLFRVDPTKVVCDLHPGYNSARWATEFARRHGIELIKVQHHHAHVASLLAEQQLAPETPTIGVAFDGTGYGTDGAIWGGEVLIVKGNEFERFAHLRYSPLPGGDTCVRTPARTCLSYLRTAGIDWLPSLPCVAHYAPIELRVLGRQLVRDLNCVPTSSMGRLFDAVAALLGVRQQVTYEGQAAIELEALCDNHSTTRTYPAVIIPGAPAILDPEPLLRSIVSDLQAGVPRDQIAQGFHQAVATWILSACILARKQTTLNLVALTGGVMQNLVLLRLTLRLLRQAEFDVRVHRIVPPNDGGLSLGQARLGNWQ